MKFEKNAQVNRLAIYFFYDKDGVVDRYVPYFLNDLKKNCAEIFIICNGKLTSEGRDTLLKITPKLLVRENKGFDVWAYKTALEQYGWEKIEEYDEVVFVNFTLFGPLYPFAEAFNYMKEQNVDFWGMNLYHKVDSDPFGTICYGYIPDHIQSSFIVVRNSMLKSTEFHDYWDNRPMINSYADAVGKHEAIFTKHFADCGFKWKVYIDTEDLKDYHAYPLMYEPLVLIRDKRCPVLKRKAFALEYTSFISFCVGEPTVEALNYVQKNLDYDVDMIWENILRSFNMADIKNCLHLNYVLPRNQLMADQRELTLKTALFMHVYYEDQFELCAHYAKSMPDSADIYFILTSEELRKRVEDQKKEFYPRKTTVLSVENRGRDVSALLVAAKPFVAQYDLVCFAHDKKTPQAKPNINGQSFAYQCFENVLGSSEYVVNIIKKFEEEKHMGMLVPPSPMFGVFYGIFGAEWGANYDNTVKLAEILDIHVDITLEKEPIAPIGTMFWFRPVALMKLFDYGWKYEDFPREPNQTDGTLLHAIERIYSYVAQDEGYYVAWGMNDKFAAIEITDYQFMLRKETECLFVQHGRVPFYQMIEHIRNNTMTPRNVIKNQIKKRVPATIWKAGKKIYKFFGGKKWLAENN